MRHGALIRLGAVVLLLSLACSSVALGAPSRFTPRPHSPGGPPAAPGDPPPSPSVPSGPEAPVPTGGLIITADTRSRIRATLVAPNRIEILANVPWRLVATAPGACMRAEGGPTGATAAYITLPAGADIYSVTAR